MSEGFILRISYVKKERLAWLSHLETIRSFERVIRRARLPYAVTEGFNPHMKIAFGAALPVGAASECEYVDVRLRDYVAPDKALAALRGQAPTALMPTACVYVNGRAPAAAVAFPLSDWQAYIGGASLEELKGAFAALCKRGFIDVERKGKAPKRVEFKGRLVEEPLFLQTRDAVLVRFTTQAREDGSLRPDRFIQAALADLPAAHVEALIRVAQRELD